MGKLMNQSKKWICILMAVVLLFSLTATVQGANAASDDLEGHWAEANMRQWVESGLLQGYADGSFKPDRIVSRAEFAALINRSFHLTEKATISFSDVTSNNWTYESIQVALKAGYAGGYPDGTFRPNQQVTREQAAIMTARLLQLESDSTKALDQFNDKTALSQTGQAAVAALLEDQLIKGLPDGSFGAHKGLTRAQAVTLLSDALAFANPTIVYDQAGVYGPESGQEIIKGNIVIAAPGVTLRNVVVTGNLTVAKEVGEGDVFFKGIAVQGETVINGGGANSVHFEDSVLLRMTVNKSEGHGACACCGRNLC